MAHLAVPRLEIEIGLREKQWDAIEHAASKLSEYTSDQPNPWTDFHIRRGRVISAWGRSARGDNYCADLSELRKVRESTGMVIWLPDD
jgi:hypothetical protein